MAKGSLACVDRIHGEEPQPAIRMGYQFQMRAIHPALTISLSTHLLVRLICLATDKFLLNLA
jgi:hypothetical protein